VCVFIPCRAHPHVDKPESETRSSSPVSRRTRYGTRVFEAAVDASAPPGLGFFSF
jgi:hypothetical protein